MGAATPASIKCVKGGFLLAKKFGKFPVAVLTRFRGEIDSDR